ncbi:thymidine kinase [Exiguobacterium sp. s163]|uniref:thymidine kinase n=1 Tax=Exiguobacterium sp. s163 TaxID=2751287 RepID=UPI001BE90CD9|nr:thymidine kinase [Exiguobacterium sp. s163]
MTKKIKEGLIVECGSMFSGKSDAIRRKGKRYEYAGLRTIFIKPQLDNRYSETYLMTHDGNKVLATSVCEHLSIIEMDEVKSADVVLIDEIQFFSSNIISDIQSLIQMGKRVYVAGLDLDFKGNPFYVTQQLMSIADEVNKHKAVCMGCGEDAYISHKKIPNDKIVELGHSDLYEALCRHCYDSKKEK